MKSLRISIIATILAIIFMSKFVYAEYESEQVYEYTEKELEQLEQERELILNRIRFKKENRSFDHGVYARVNVTRFEQETDYYCGPATIKQTMDSVTGYSDSQSYYADRIGTTRDGSEFRILARYLVRNAVNRYPDYVYEEIGSYSYWLERVYYCLEDKRKPVVLDVANFAPDSSGHFINIDIIDGRRGDVKVRVVDPNNDRRYGGYVWYDAYDVYLKNDRHWLNSALW